MEAVAELCGAMADRGRYDIRLEAAIAKLYNSEAGWRIIDDTVQIRGGRGYETADSLRARGERPVPIERIMRDFRINLIFEGSSEIMHLFIAREAVDKHLAIAGDVVLPGRSVGQRLRGLVRAVAFYGWWYPSRWLGWSRWPRYGEFGLLAGHLRRADRAARRLARSVFHAMLRYGPALEQRQAVLFRLVDVGAELFAISAACARAQALRFADPVTGGRAVELADLFCRHAWRRIDAHFRALRRNDDTRTYHAARRVLAGDHRWLERGTIEPGSGVPPAEALPPSPSSPAG
jgi:acyl-CoA dehydrogenase-like protein/ACAD9/ACADV-like protein